MLDLKVDSPWSVQKKNLHHDRLNQWETQRQRNATVTLFITIPNIFSYM